MIIMPRKKSKDSIPTETNMLLVGALFSWEFYLLIYTAISDG